jgi:CubicO group peptidase (beta-lactamase class C family)
MLIDSHQIRALLDRFRHRLDVPAVGAAVVDIGGSFYCEVIGESHRGGTTPATADDQWHIGSCGKAITALLYARLVELGLARWDAAVPDLIPDQVRHFDPGWNIATIDDLFLCRSGMKANASHREMSAAWSDERSLVDQRTAAAVAAMTRPPRSAGSFRYSNLGYVVAGAAIDRIAGEPFERSLQRHVWEPLGITTFGVGPPPNIWGHRPRIQLGGLLVGRGTPADPGATRSDNPPVLNSAGRFHLTLRDWATLQRAFLTPGLLVRAESIERLLTVPNGGDRGMAMGWAPTRNSEVAAFGQQGSNTMWAATALLSSDRTRTAMVVANDGRTRVLGKQARLAQTILETL